MLRKLRNEAISDKLAGGGSQLRGRRRRRRGVRRGRHVPQRSDLRGQNLIRRFHCGRSSNMVRSHEN